MTLAIKGLTTLLLSQSKHKMNRNNKNAQIQKLMSKLNNLKNPKKKNKNQKKPNSSSQQQLVNPKTFTIAKQGKKMPMYPPMALSKCALKFALAIADPFHPAAKGACLPCFPSPLSQKVTGYTRFNAVVGSTGFGFLQVCPCVANDLPIAFYSSSTAYGLTNVQALSANNVLFNGVVAANLTNLPYNSSTLANSVQGGDNIAARVVSIGVRVSYVGTTLNESGTYSCLVSPTHENLGITASTQANLSAYAEACVTSITREVCELSAFPVSPMETQYGTATQVNQVTPLLYPYSNNDTVITTQGYTYAVNTLLVGSSPILVTFTGTAGNSFLVEIIEHVEYSGLVSSAFSTPTDSDQKGFEIVSAAADRLPGLIMSYPKKPRLDLLQDAIASVAKALKPVAISVLTNGIAAMLL